MNTHRTEMTDRQLAAQVRFGRLVTFETPDLSTKLVTGYVSGFDADNIRLVIPRSINDLGKLTWSIDNRSIHRDYIAAIDYHSESTMGKEAVARELETMTKRFRDHVLEKYFPDRPRR